MSWFPLTTVEVVMKVITRFFVILTEYDVS